MVTRLLFNLPLIVVVAFVFFSCNPPSPTEPKESVAKLESKYINKTGKTLILKVQADNGEKDSKWLNAGESAVFLFSNKVDNGDITQEKCPKMYKEKIICLNDTALNLFKLEDNFMPIYDMMYLYNDRNVVEFKDGCVYKTLTIDDDFTKYLLIYAPTLLQDYPDFYHK